MSLPLGIFKMGKQSLTSKSLNVQRTKRPEFASDLSDYGASSGAFLLMPKLFEANVGFCSLLMWGIIQFPGVIMMSKIIPSIPQSAKEISNSRI
jgi:hypothetical protein